MKKIFIILSLFIIFTIFINNSKASAFNFADEYGVNMTYKTLKLYDIQESDFEFTGLWWDWQQDGVVGHTFGYEPVENSLLDLIRYWGKSAPVFMELYTPGRTLEYVEDYTMLPTEGGIGWSVEDGWLYIIVKDDYFQEYFPGFTPLEAMGEIAEAIRVDTWVITETTSDYQTGYNTGYQHGFNSGHSTGYNRGYTEGWEAKEAEINALLPGIRQAEYQRGYEDGYDDGVIVGETVAYEKGYMDGANESFIASIDKWLVPAVIIVMLLGGFFAIVRKKQEGDI